MRNKNAKVSDPNKFTTNCGEDIKILYSGKLMPDGSVRLIEAGKESMSDKINAEKEFTDISYIANRLAMGDTSVIRDGAVYGDFTKVPKSLAESLQIIIDGQAKFDALPLDTKNKFDNNYYKWIMESGSVDWMNKMGVPLQEIVNEVKESDVSES